VSLTISAELQASCLQQTVQGAASLPIAIIGGSGLDDYPGAETVAKISIPTAFSEQPVSLFQIRLPLANETLVYFLPRHGSEHSIAPHLINYRANIWALKALQIEKLIAVNAVGGISNELPPGSLALVSDVIDYSHSRSSTFFDGLSYPLDHIDCSELFNAQMNQDIADLAAIPTGFVYGCTQGPRLETPAEIKRLKQDGCDLVGMTLMPEAALAAEANIPYVALAMVVNWAAGISSTPITMDEIYSQLGSCTTQVRQIIESYCVKMR